MGKSPGACLSQSVTRPQKRHFNVPISSLFKKKKNLLWFYAWFFSLNWHSSIVQASWSSWKNNHINKLHSGLLKSSRLFLAHVRGRHSEQNAEGTAQSACCSSPGQKLCQAALICCHNGPSKLHKVIYKDGPRAWGEEKRRGFISINIRVERLSKYWNYWQFGLLLQFWEETLHSLTEQYSW